MTIWSSGYRVKSIKPLDSEKALKDGAEFVGEGFIFTVSLSLLMWEYNRSQESAREKQEKKRQQIRAEQAVLKAKLHALDVRLKAVEDVVKEQTDSLLGLSKGRYKRPPSKELVPIDDFDDDAIEKLVGEEVRTLEQEEDAETSVSTSKRWWQFWLNGAKDSTE